MTDPRITFSRATAADVAAIVPLVESAYRGESSRAGWTTEADLLDGQRTDADWVASMIATDGTVILLARDPDGRLLACCELGAPKAPGGPSYFGMFAVVPGLQGGGIGRAVLAEAERMAADELGATSMEMTVIVQRPELIEWYLRRGYRRSGLTKAFPYGDERFGRPRRDDLAFEVLAKPLG